MPDLDRQDTAVELKKPELVDFSTNASIDEKLAQHGTLADSHPTVRYARDLFGRIHQGEPAIQVFIMESAPEVNAFASSDGRIVLSRGLVEFCESDEELLYVLQHERTHLLREHEAQQQAAQEVERGFGIRHLFDVGMTRIFEMGEADVEALMELDDMGVNVDGALTFMRRLRERTLAESKGKQQLDLGHGSFEDRLLAFKMSFLARDYRSYKKGVQTSKSDALRDPSLYEDQWGFPVAAGTIRKPGDKNTKNWDVRRAAVERMTAYQLRINGELLRVSLEYEKRRIKKLKGKKSAFNARLILVCKDYVDKAAPLYDRIEELFYTKAQQEFGLSREQVDATYKLRECLGLYYRDIHVSGESLTERLKDQEFKGAFETLAAVDLMQWATIMRSSFVVKKKLSDAELDEIRATFTGPEQDVAIQIVSFIYNGEWHQEEAERDEQLTLRRRLPKGWKLEDISLLDKARTFKIADNMVSWKDVTPDEAWADLEGSVLERERRVPYSETFLRILQTIFGLYGGGKYRNYTRLIERINAEVEDGFERTCLASLLVGAGLNSYVRSDGAVAPDQLQNDLLYLARFLEATAPNSYSDSVENAGRGLVEKIYSSVIPSGFDEGFFVLSHLKGGAPDYVYHAVYSEWTSKLVPPLTVEGLAQLETDDVVGANAGVSLLLVLDRQLAGNPSTLISDPSSLDALLDQMERLCGTSALASLRQDSGNRYPAFYHLLGSTPLRVADFDEAILLLRVAKWAPDPTERYALETNVWEAILAQWGTLGTSVREVLDKVPSSVEVPFNIMTQVVEQFAKTADDLEVCQAYMVSRVKNPMQVGKAVVVHDGIRDVLMRGGPKRRLKFMKAMLMKEQDEELKALLMDAFIEGIERKELLGIVGDEFDGEMIAQQKLEKAPDLVLRRLYSLDDVQRRMVVHALLTGPQGLLRHPDQMEEVIGLLFDEYVESDGDADDVRFVGEVQKILKMMIRVANPEDVYLVLSGLLSKRILQASYKDDWTDGSAYEKHKRCFAQELGIVDYDDACDHVEGQNDDDEYWGDNDEYGLEDLEKVKLACIYGEVDGARGYEKERAPVLHLLTFDRRVGTTEKMDAVGLLVELAQSLRSIGTRGLQVADMYIDLPPKYQGMRSKIYSDMEGQSKLTAYDTMKRSMSARHLEGLEIGERMGGGAMVTVYPFKSSSMEGVVKVLNPNVETFTDSTFQVLDRTFAQLLQDDPARYRVLGLLLEDIRWWVKADMDLAASASQDEQFTAQQGGGEFSGGWRTAVPKVFYRDSHCLIEAKASGASLDRVRVSESLAEELVTVVQESVRCQVMQGIMHSDVHPGNITLDTVARKLSWLDRTLLLQLRPQDQMMLIQVAMATSDEARLNAIVEGLIAMPENAGVSGELQAAVRGELGNLEGDDFESRVRELSVRVRGHRGFVVPPHMTLVFKNLLSLNKLKDRIPREE